MTADVGLDLTAAFPNLLREDVQIVQAQLVPFYPTSGAFAVNLSSGPVSIPYRLYVNPPGETRLTATQRSILDCLYTRHSDGQVREAHLGALLAQSEEWVCPYVWTLLGEYVIEIVDLIVAHADRLDRPLYAGFLARNPGFRERTRQRAVSYWDCYYRGRFKTFEQYPAQTVFALFDGPR